MVSYTMQYGATHGFGQIFKKGVKRTPEQMEEDERLSVLMDRALAKALDE